jgi:hypothetical protein
MILYKDLKNMKLYNKPVYFPFNTKNKLKDSIMFLITPNIDESIKIINTKDCNKQYDSYYIEKDISFIISQESFLSNSDDIILEEDSIINETVLDVEKHRYLYTQTKEGLLEAMNEFGIDYIMDESSITIINNDKLNSLLEAEDNSNILSSSKYNKILKQLLYRERFKTPKDVVLVYDKIKKECKSIKYAYLYMDKYRRRNMYVDFFYYNENFFKNNYMSNMKGIYLYLELLHRFIKDERFDSYNKVSYIPVDGWYRNLPEGVNSTLDMKNINPISLFSRLLRRNPDKIKELLSGEEFVFTNGNTQFKLVVDDINNETYIKFNKFINIIENNLPIPPEEQDSMANNNSSTKSIVMAILSKLETGKAKIKINSLTGEDGSIDEKELLNRIENAAEKSSDIEATMEELENDPEFKELILKMAAEQDNSGKISKQRLDRLENLNKELRQKEINNIKLDDILGPDTDKELTSTNLSTRIDTVNEEEWSNLKYMNIENDYDVNKDIINCITELLTKSSYPVAVRDIKIEDSSTSEDYKDTYTVFCEDSFGKRFQFKFDVPKFKDNKFLIIKGNDKTINGQLLLLPISKTDPDTVQIVSNYNKIFIKRYGQKSDSVTDRLIKTINKTDKIKSTIGDCTLANNIYDVPYTYEYLASQYNKLETKDVIVYLNQKEIRTKYNIEKVPQGKIPIAYHKTSKEVIYSSFPDVPNKILDLLIGDDNELRELYNNTTKGKKYIYSRASILNTQIPLAIIICYQIGLTEMLKKANIKYTIKEKLDQSDKKADNADFIRFSDGYIVFECTNSSNLLLNGIKDVTTEIYSIGDIDSKSMWIEILDNYGPRAKLSDGIENFYDCMIDYITLQSLIHYGLPTEFTDILLYANDLLASTQYSNHTNMDAYRYRSNEIVAAYAYKELAYAYNDYKNKIKKGFKNATISMKQSAVIDEVLMANTAGDYSYTTPIGELEAINALSTKGHSGMNADRAYKADKRSYDPSMINILACATNFAGNSGIVRQATINMNVDTIRGYIKTTKNRDDMNITSSFSIQEALTPYGVTRNDAMRSAMDFIQTSKHQLPTKISFPSLITNGADQALPYMVTNNFAFKAKKNGTVETITDDYMIVTYSDGTHDFIDLRNNIRKNSDGGFYITLQLSTELKVGDKFKANDIIAYDKFSFDHAYGANDNLTYSMGLLTKVAIMSTEEGFEDSTIVSEYLSDALTSYIDVKKDVSMDKNAILLDIVKKGDYVQEGDTLLVFQDAYDEEDVNALMKSLSGDVELVSDLGRFTIKAKANGIISDIKVYRTCEIDELSDSLKKFVTEIEKPIKKIKSAQKKYGIDYIYGLESTEALPVVGKLKNIESGILIEIYLEYEDKLAVGDKIVDYSAVKGVCRTVLEKGKEPTSSYRPDEKIHTILCVASTLARMTGAPIIVGAINKAMIELDRHAKDLAGIKWKYLDQM